MGRPPGWAAAATGGHRCDRQAGRRSRGGSIDRRSGRRSLEARRARMPGSRPVCHRRSGRAGSVKLAACQRRVSSRTQVAISHSRSARRSRSVEPMGAGEIARHLGRSPSTISRELRRNAATRGGQLVYRAAIAQWHRDRRTTRPKEAKLAVNERLREYVQDRLAGEICTPRWDTGARAGDAVERSPPRPPTGPALGQLVESRADRPSVAGGLPR